MLTSLTNTKLDKNTLSALRDFLFNIFAATLHTGCRVPHPQPEDAPCSGDRREGVCEIGNEHSGSIKYGEFLE
jgi:hypothetical protein